MAKELPHLVDVQPGINSLIINRVVAYIKCLLTKSNLEQLRGMSGFRCEPDASERQYAFPRVARNP